MKKAVLRSLGILLALPAALALACAVTGTGGGFLDLSSLAKGVCIGIAVICGVLAAVAWRCAKSPK